ncbi:CD225/dispanin family protein [Rhodococcus spongiicola]|uniref:CD225/dispanin family protein n=1 Tax=Rhodococcus spongiicola TaxID=2487352 RepID=A0A438B592_9NOCA|nr:CD225/dispanin family protein [Rhodococcus spongiicola]RVW06163.1 CD225/dispanin family protein [Rhodococcus spongiicola]
MSEPTINTGPEGSPTDQHGSSARYAQQPYPGVPQYATVPPAAQYGGPPPLPPLNAGWAAASIIFFWPLAFAAFNHLHSIFPRWAMGDYQGAQYASDRVKTLGKISLGIAIALFALYAVFMIVVLGFLVVDETSGTTGTTSIYNG